MYSTAKEANEEINMPDGEMAHQELLALFFSERCNVITLDNELIGIQIGDFLIQKKSYTCTGCQIEWVTFKEIPPSFCPLHAPLCEECGDRCFNGTIDGLCVTCYKKEIFE